jgi:hypothetical protein
MIVYRDLERFVHTRDLLCRLSEAIREELRVGRPCHASSVRLLVEFGQLEAAWSDHLMPEQDDSGAETRALRQVAIGIGHLLRHAWSATELPPSLAARIGAAVSLLHEHDPPPILRVKVPEGFAFYGLYPETYMQAAEQFALAQRPATAVCIGLRSIGTALSGLVAATLEGLGWQVVSYTLRPRGDPFARKPLLAPGLAASLARHSGDYALLVDEGPGLSGSSLAGTAAALNELGYPNRKIRFFPSWRPDPRRLHSPEAQARWRLHEAHVGSFEQTWIESGKLSDKTLRPIDAGRWRGLFFQDRDYPAVQPQHERRKFLTVERNPRLLKFAGIGPFGDSALQRAHMLSQAGYSPPVDELRHGFLVQPFIVGKPLQASDCTAALIDTVARYLAFVQRSFPAQEHTSGEELCHMAAANGHDLLGSDAEGIAAVLHGDEFANASPVAVDGHMQPWEWIATAHGYLKTDALDHHADHFFPGNTDIAWDLAGFSIEFGLDVDGAELLSRLFTRYSGDTRIGARLPLFRFAYTAFRAGYTTLAEQATSGTPDAARFHRLTEIYRIQLRHTLFELNHPEGGRA